MCLSQLRRGSLQRQAVNMAKRIAASCLPLHTRARGEGHAALLTAHEVILTYFPACKFLLGLSFFFNSVLLTLLLKSASLFVLSGLEKLLSILIEHYHKDNKRQYQQFLSSVASLGRQRDNIKGSTLISGEHVKPCNETSWNCLITAQEMKLQDDSLIKQWLRIFCLLSNTVCNAF